MVGTFPNKNNENPMKNMKGKKPHSDDTLYFWELKFRKMT